MAGEFSDLPDRALVDVGNGVTSPHALCRRQRQRRDARRAGVDVLSGRRGDRHVLRHGPADRESARGGRDRDHHVPAAGRAITDDHPRARADVARDDRCRSRSPASKSVALSTIVESHATTPLVVERTMSWDSSAYGAHTEKATAGAARGWIFAEGSERRRRRVLPDVSCCWRIPTPRRTSRPSSICVKVKDAAGAHLRSGAAVAPAP